jgi:hypothetical protein
VVAKKLVDAKPTITVAPLCPMADVIYDNNMLEILMTKRT